MSPCRLAALPLENEQHMQRLALLEQKRRDNVARMRMFRALEDELAAKQREIRTAEETAKSEEERRISWTNRRRVWEAHLKEHFGLEHGTPEMAARVDEDIGGEVAPVS